MLFFKDKLAYRIIVLLVLGFSELTISNWILNAQSSFKHIDVENGLSNSEIRSIFQDSYGFMWIGTQHGLNKYDSYNFEIFHYNPGKEKSLSGSAVTEIYEDQSKNLWIGTESGVSTYSHESDNFRHYKIINNTGYVFNVDVYEIFENIQEKLVILSNENLFIFDSKSINDTRSSFISTSNNTFAVKGGRSALEDNNGIIWIATEGNGLKLFDCRNRKFIYDTLNYPILKYVDDLYLNKIFSNDKGNGIYICSRNSGVYKCTDYKSRPTKIEHLENNENSLSNNTTFDAFQDVNNNLWIATASGIDRVEINTGNFKHFNTQPQNGSLSSNVVRVIYQDIYKNMWFGTGRSGINILEENKFSHSYKVFSHNPFDSNSLSNNPVLSFTEDDNANIWVGTDWGGISIFNKEGKLIKHLQHEPNNEKTIGSNAVTSMLKSDDGKIWAGCFRGGVHIINTKSFEVEKKLVADGTKSGLSNNSITNIYKDKNGIIWIATSGGGINKFDPDKWENKKIKSNNKWDGKTISTDFILQTFDNNDGVIWLATYFGLNKYDTATAKFTYYLANPNDKKALSHNWVYSLCSDKDGCLWVGTANGLNKYEPENDGFAVFKKEDGLSDNVISGIVSDTKGNLWISTGKGVNRMNPKTYQIKKFNIENKDYNNEFTHGVYYKCRNRDILFGGSKGFIRFNPDSLIFQDDRIPKVLFTKLKLFNQQVQINSNGILKKSILLTDSIILKHNHSVISIEYATPGQINTDKINYQYKLDGFDNYWINAGKSRTVTYTNLSQGKYLFKVRASFSDDFSNENISSIYLEIKPAPWNTIYAWIIYLLLFVGLLYFFRRYSLISVVRKNQLLIEKINRENSEKITQSKLQFFTNIAHEIRTPLTLILGPFNKDNPNISKSETELIKKNANKLLRLVNQILDFRKVNSGKMQSLIYKEDIPKLLKELVLSFKAEAERKKIKVIYESVFESYFAPTDADKLDKIISNIISNAIKYNKPNGLVQVKFHVSKTKKKLIDKYPDGFFSIEVADTGIGIPVEDQPYIFDRFYTGRKSFLKNSSGIGLALVKEFVDLLGGIIEVESKTGKGTVFRVSMPVSSENFEQEETEQGEAHVEIGSVDNNVKDATDEGDLLTDYNYEAHNKAVLIIDDNQDIRTYLRNIFKKEFKVITEDNGKSGLESAMMHYPDIIIADIMMPGMDGIEFCSRLKSDVRLSHIPVILLTALTQVESKIKGLEIGADDYIEKPFDERILMLKVKNTLKMQDLLKSKYSEGINQGKTLLPQNKVENSFMDKVIAVISQNLDNPLFGVNDILVEIGMSRSVFYRKIKAVTNKSVVELIHSMRLKKAEELLKNRENQVADVAALTGFNDPSYFIKLFKENYGMTPGEFKDRVEGSI